MRGSDGQTRPLFSFVDLEERVPARHPLRKIRQIVKDALAKLDGEFSKLYASEGRPSIAPEKLLRASLLQAFYSIRSQRQLVKQLDYNLLFLWFVGLGVDDPIWVPTVFTKNRDRLLDADVAARFMAAMLGQREVKPHLSNDHFSVDGTLVEAGASFKSFRAKDGNDKPPGPGRNGERDFRREKRANDRSGTTDPDARLYRKSSNTAAELCFIGHALAENRHGLIVQADATKASSRAERETAIAMIERHSSGSERRLTLAADKGYYTKGFAAECRRMCVTPHVAAKVKHSAVERRTRRHASYAVSQRKRKLIEEAFG